MKTDEKRKTIKVKAGFLGQRMFILPHRILTICKTDPLINSLYFTDIGYFPKAKNHYVHRRKGSEQYVLIYCHKGQGKLFLNKEKNTLSPNTFYIIPPNTPHLYQASKTNPWSIYWVHFTGSQAKFLYAKFLDIYAAEIPGVSFVERRLNLFDNLMDVLEDGYRTSNVEYVNLSLWQLLNSFLYQDFFVEVGKRKNEDNITDSIITYMKSQLDKALKIEEMALYFNYSPSHFFSIFKKKTGFSPINYFNDLKIQKACQYLSFTSMSVKEISYTLGFNDPLYFSRLFKKIMGVPPLRYRNIYKH